jgi:hypothetical protein
MADDLERNRLEVKLAPAERANHRHHRVRVAVSTNPEWYQRICAQHAVQRARVRRIRHDTAIRREHVLRALRKIASASAPRQCTSLIRPPTYQKLLLPVIKKEIENEKARSDHERKTATPVEASRQPAARDDDGWAPF